MQGYKGCRDTREAGVARRCQGAGVPGYGSVQGVQGVQQVQGCNDCKGVQGMGGVQKCTPDDAECSIPAIQVGPGALWGALLIAPQHTREESVKVPEVGVLGVYGCLLLEAAAGSGLRQSIGRLRWKNLEPVIVWVCWGCNHPDATACRAMLL